ncbi:hypothetical protein EDC04DRAFT_2870714 [Pisolithus marmoratus]|nr:hypothetical protein EDC04DRAFT_2870714 [Pisolithus marmoratus]
MNEQGQKGEPTASVDTQQALATSLSFPRQTQPVVVRRRPYFESFYTLMTFQTEIISAAQRGDLATIRELVESGKATVNDRDSQNCVGAFAELATTPSFTLTPTINAQLATCRYLIEQGADGTTALHLVTHSSSVMPLLYLLHQPVNVDSRDMQGHTPLMWAAYQGDALSVDLLLKHGANPNLKDDVGLTPLHWAVIGADIHAKDAEGRTPRDMAVELKSFGAPLNERNTRIAIFLLPALFFYIIFVTLSILPWYTGLILAMAEFFALHHIVTRYVETVNQSPYFAGIIAGSMMWVGYAWLTRLVTSNHQNLQAIRSVHLAFALNMGLCVYNFFRAIMLDPGTCPRTISMVIEKLALLQIIEDLASEGRLNGQTFCIQCMVCFGSNNHRQFLMFVTTLVAGIILFDYLTMNVLYASATPPDNIAADCSPIFCVPAAIDSFLLSVSLWSTLQLTWTSVLLVTQFWQVSRQLTTLEVSNLGRYGSMGGRGGFASGSGATGIQMGHRHHHAVNGERGDEESEGEGGHKHRHHHIGLCKALSAPGTCGAFLLNLVGLDRFTRGRAAHGLALGSSSARARNPFDLGVVRNCRDFWTMGKEVGVDYGQVYDVPPEGFEEAKMKRGVERGEFERDHDAGGRTKSLLGRLGLRMGTSSSRRGYEPLSQV